MKLKFWHRIILLIGSILMVIIGGAILVGSLQFNEIPIRLEGEGFFTVTRMVLLFAGAITVFFGVFAFSLPGRMKISKNRFVVRKTESGEMRISVQAIESIVQKSLTQHEEIKLQNLQVINTKSGVIIEMKISLAGNINFPAAVETLQKHIRQHLNATSGIDVKDILISIENAESSVKASPYLVKPEELDLKKESAEKGNPEAVHGRDMPGTDKKEGLL